MEQNHDWKSLQEDPEIRISAGGPDWERANNPNQETGASAMEEDANEESLADSMVWDSGASLIPSGFTIPRSAGKPSRFSWKKV